MVEEEQTADALAKVTTLRQSREQADAFMDRSVLESAGISCFLRDKIQSESIGYGRT